MIAAAFGLLFAGAGVGIHLEQYGGLELEDTSRVLDALSHAIERRTGIKPVLDDPLWPACQTEDRCLPAIKERLKADEVVMVLLFGAPRRIRFIAERQPSSRKIELDVTRDETAWADPFDKIAAALFPDAQKPAAIGGLVKGPVAPPVQVGLERYTKSIASFGGGALSLGVGIVLEVLSYNARHDIETVSMTDDEYHSTLTRMRATGAVADVLFGLSAICIAAGIMFLISDARD